ncbi:MAG: hypothetical protein AB7V32_00150 [Candidatus Berkiella sp.]
MMLMHEIDIDAILALCSEPDRQIFEEIAVSNEERKQILLSA